MLGVQQDALGDAQAASARPWYVVDGTWSSLLRVVWLFSITHATKTPPTQKQEAENDPTHVDVHIPEMINGAHHFGPPHDPLFAFDHDDVFGNMHHGGVTAHAGQPLTIVVPPQQPHIIHAPPPDADMHPAGGSSYPPGTSPPGAYFTPMPPPNHPHNAFGGGDAMHDPLAEMADALHGPSGEASAPWSGPHSGSGGIPPRHGSGMVTHPGGSVCAPPMMHPTGSMHAPTSLQGTSTGAPAHHANDGHPSWPGFGQPFVVPDVADNDAHGGEDDHTSDLLRGVGLSPSPPPLPPDWDMSVKPSGLLFDFDSFNVSKQQHNTGTRPFVTVTSAMNPTDMVHPSDDYIMQVCLNVCGFNGGDVVVAVVVAISCCLTSLTHFLQHTQILFGDANEPVPRRMTTHLHQFEMLDDGLPDFDRDLAHEALDDLLSKDHDLDAATPHLTGPSGDMHAGDLAFGHAGGGSLHHHPGGLLPPPNGQIPPAAGHGKGIPPAGCDFPVCCSLTVAA